MSEHYGPECPDCNVYTVERHVMNKPYWYCQSCKNEVVANPNLGYGEPCFKVLKADRGKIKLNGKEIQVESAEIRIDDVGRRWGSSQANIQSIMRSKRILEAPYEKVEIITAENYDRIFEAFAQSIRENLQEFVGRPLSTPVIEQIHDEIVIRINEE